MEENFPRGGSLPSNAIHRKRKYVEDEDEEHMLLPSDDKFIGKPKKVGKSQKLNKRKKNVLRVEEKRSFSDIACTGMLVLGCIREIRDYELCVSLPGRLKGIVPITNISDAYSAVLTRLAESSGFEIDQDDMGVSKLDNLFHIGMIVRCRVEEVTTNPSGKTSIKLTLNAREINSALSLTSLKTGLVLTGCIMSCEDHGYVIDLGIQGVTAFLSTAEANKYAETVSREGERLCIGRYLQCMVSGDNHMDMAAGESRVIRVVADPKIVHRSLVSESMKLTIPKILPGLVAACTIVRVSDDGVAVEFLSYSGFVSKNHLLSSPHKYAINQEVKLAVLYVHPITKVINLTELSHLVTPDLAPQRLFGNVIVGDVINDAEVLSVDQKSGVYLKLGNKLKGFASLKHISQKDLKNIYANFKRGATKRCRVVDLNFVDRLAMVSCKRFDIILMARINASKLVAIEPPSSCTVDKVHPLGVSVRVTGYIRGFIPRFHLSEVPLKNVAKKFTSGKKLRCKVLTVDALSSKLLLMHRKSLTNSTLPPITDYSQCSPGVIAEGFVATVNSAGLLVVFYNNVKGWVPTKEISSEMLRQPPETLYYRGQVVKTRMLNCREENGVPRLFLSLKMNEDETNCINEKLLPDDYNIGKILQCRVTTLLSDGVQVDLLPEGLKSFLPRMHFSDHKTNCDQLLKIYRVNDILDNVMLYSKFKNRLLVTRKQSLIDASMHGNLVTGVDVLQVGLMVAGVVMKKMSYGLLVDVNGFTGLVPNKYIVDKKHPDPQSLVYEGQSVMPKVMEIDRDAKRFLLSLRMSDCYQNNTDIGIELLDQFLNEYKILLNSLRSTTTDSKVPLNELRIGQVVDITVTEVVKLGVLCMIEDCSVKGFVTIDNMTGVVCKEGEKHKALILYIDVADKCVQLTIVPAVVTAALHFKQNKFTQVRPLQMLKSEVQLITQDFVLVMLKGHAAGQLAYLPAKKHLNDFVERFQYQVGQINRVVIKRVDDGKILASLEIHEDQNDDKSEAKLSGKYFIKDLPHMGTVHRARVEKVDDHQMNISVTGIPGRVHITEVVDGESPSNPLHSYSVGMEFPVKILAYHDPKSNRYFPVSHSKLSKVLLECTIKPSKMVASGSTNNLMNPVVRCGDAVVGYVISHEYKCIRVQISTQLKGIVHILNVSDNISILSTAAQHFKVGCGYQATVLSKGDKLGGLNLAIADRSVGELKTGMAVPGMVLSVNDHGLFVQLPYRQMGEVSLNNLVSNAQQGASVLETYKKNEFLECRVLRLLDAPRQKWSIAVKQTSHLLSTVEESAKAEFCPDLKSRNKRKRKLAMGESSGEDKKTAKVEVPNPSNTNPRKLHVEDGFSWEGNFSLPPVDIAKGKEEESSGDEDSGYEGPPVIGKTKNLENEREKARKLLEAETQLLDGSRLPQSINEFDRLVLQSPDSSLVWLRYMSYHLELTEIDKARAIAERALKTISFREEQEKLNVWLGYLNMESMYGTQESTTKLLDRAIKLNDSFKVLKGMVEIYVRAEKYEAAEELCSTLVRRFKDHPEAWIQSFHVYFLHAKPEEARKLLDKSLLTIDKKSHIDVLNKFAQLEWKLGSADRAKTVFRMILGNYPKRTDLWSIFIDACIKYGDVEEARKLFEQVTSLEMNTKKLKYLFKKFLDFERKFGTDETLLAVKQKAINYVETKLL